MKSFSPGKIVRDFATMRVGLTLLAIIIVLAVAGTIIPQEREIDAGPVLHFFYHTLGLGSLYHSWWFSTLLFLLCLNMACCSLCRLPALWRETVAPPPWPLAAAWQRECRLDCPPEAATRQLKQFLERAGFRIWDFAGNRLYARKGQLAPWGTFLVHTSVLLIALGGFYGSLAGFQYSIRLAPGEVVTIGARPNPGVGRPFELRLNSFATELYPNGQVSDWISNLTVVRDGNEVVSQDVKVNHPLSYGGISFYQSSYATFYDIEQRMAGRSGRTVRAEERQPLILDNRQGLAVVPLKYVPDYDPQRPLVSRSARPLNPHVIYMAYSDGRPLGMNAVPLGKPLTLPGTPAELVFVAVREVSGLEVKHDPGLPLVFAGFGIMSAAFFLSLFPRRRVVVAEARNDGEAAVLLIAIHGKPQLLEEELSGLCRDLAVNSNNTAAREAT